MKEQRYVVRFYWSRTMRQKVWQVVDTVTEQWVCEAMDKPAMARQARKLNEQAKQALTVQEPHP